MGKNSLFKSTTKSKSKKAKGKKEDVKAVSQKSKKKNAAKSTPKAKTKAIKKKSVKKAPAKKKSTQRELLFKNFGTWAPNQIDTMAVSTANDQYSAPPFFEYSDEKTKKELHKLLFKKFDLKKSGTKASPKIIKAKASVAKASTKKKAKPKKQKLTMRELISKSFGSWKPSKQLSPPVAIPESNQTYSAPPIFADQTKTGKQQLKALLFRKFDLNEIRAAAKKPTIKKLSIRELISKSFESWHPKNLFVPKTDQKTTENKYTAPEYFSDKSPEDAKNLRKLLFKTFEIPEAGIEPEELSEIEPKIRPEIEPETGSDKIDSNGTDYPPSAVKEGNPMKSFFKLCLAAIVILAIVWVGASYKNEEKYFIKKTDNGIAIWKGEFNPFDKKLFITLPGGVLPAHPKSFYTKADVYPLIVKYYVNKADELLVAPGIPDFTMMIKYLTKAQGYVDDKSSSNSARLRLDMIDFIVQFYKASIAGDKKTKEGLEEAINILEQTKILSLDKGTHDFIQQKLDGYQKALEALAPKFEEVQPSLKE